MAAGTGMGDTGSMGDTGNTDMAGMESTVAIVNMAAAVQNGNRISVLMQRR